MSEEKGVKPEVATPVQPPVEEVKPTEVVSEDVKTPEVEGQVDQSVYEKVREAMKSEREAKKASNARNAELEARIAELETQTPRQEERPTNTYEAKTDLLLMVNKDNFLKENLDLVESKMAESGLDVKSALTAVKAEFFDRIQKESTPAEVNKPLNQQKPTATGEPVQQVQSVNATDTLRDVMSGKIESDPRQVEAIRKLMPQYRK